jgi:signal transduction histidine kinase
VISKKPEKLALILALSGTMAVLLAVLTDLGLSHRRDLQTGEQRLQQFSIMMAEHTARAFEAIDVLAKEISIDLSKNRHEWTEWSDVQGWEYIAQRHTRAMPQLRDLIIFDRQGNQRFISTYFPAPHINVRDRPYFVELENGARWATFGPYIGRNSGRYTYAIAHRLEDEARQFSGAAFAAIEPAYMQDFCWSNRIADEFDAVLTNRKGEIIASCRPADLSPQSGILGRLAGETLFEGRAAGLIPETGLASGDDLLISVSPIPGFPDLRLVAMISKRAVLTNWWDRFYEIGTLATLLSLLLITGAVLLRRQVAELRQLAEALGDNRQQLTARIDKATAELAREKDIAERANAAKSRFLAAASHDLRQPLHALTLFATDLTHKAAVGQLREVPRIAEQINASALNLSDMLNALLDISRLDIDGVRAEIQTFALQNVFQRLHKAFHHQADAHRLRLRIHPTRVHLRSDPQLLERMLGNLLSNAIRYTPAGGSILIGARRQGKNIRIEVRDSGIGISQENRTAIFAEFFQVANAAREQNGGLGLGLSIVDRLAKGLNIEIFLATRVGDGTTFGLLLERAEPKPMLTSEQQAFSGHVHLIGNSPAIAACQAMIRDWNYACTTGPIDALAQLRKDTILMCDADQIPARGHDLPLIILGNGSLPDSKTPPGSHVLSLPVRPARLRALLRASALRGPASGPA